MAFSQHNVIAAFTDDAAASRAGERLDSEGIRWSRMDDHGGGDTAVARAEMQDEASHAVAGPGIVATGPMTRGFSAGAAMGAVSGAIAGLGAGALWSATDAGPSTPAKFLLAAVCLAVAGTVIGFVLGGSVKATQEQEEQQSRPDTLRTQSGFLVAVSSDDQAQVEKAAELLAGLNPVRLDRVDHRGIPVGPLNRPRSET